MKHNASLVSVLACLSLIAVLSLALPPPLIAPTLSLVALLLFAQISEFLINRALDLPTLTGQLLLGIVSRHLPLH